MKLKLAVYTNYREWNNYNRSYMGYNITDGRIPNTETQNVIATNYSSMKGDMEERD